MQRISKGIWIPGLVGLLLFLIACAGFVATTPAPAPSSTPQPAPTQCATNHLPEYSDYHGSKFRYIVVYQERIDPNTVHVEIWAGTVEVLADGSGMHHTADKTDEQFAPGKYTIKLKGDDKIEVYLDTCGSLWTVPDPDATGIDIQQG